MIFCMYRVGVLFFWCVFVCVSERSRSAETDLDVVVKASGCKYRCSVFGVFVIPAAMGKSTFAGAYLCFSQAESDGILTRNIVLTFSLFKICSITRSAFHKGNDLRRSKFILMVNMKPTIGVVFLLTSSSEHVVFFMGDGSTPSRPWRTKGRNQGVCVAR